MAFPPPPPVPGGGSTPIYHPPIASKWIITGLIVFAGSVANRWNPRIREAFVHPIGFFLTALSAIAVYQIGFPPAAFALLFLLLNAWATTLPHRLKEGFLSGVNTIDWVTNDKRWFVEKVLKERPIGIQEKDVATYPVEGA
jgi:hypothetical protein